MKKFIENDAVLHSAQKIRKKVYLADYQGALTIARRVRRKYPTNAFATFLYGVGIGE